MNKFITKTGLLILALSFFHISYAQLGVTANFSGLKFTGDVGKKNNSNFFSDARLGYGLGVEYRIGKILGIGLDGFYGKLAGTDNDKSSHRNFQTTISGGGLSLFAFMDKIGGKDRQVSPYFQTGFGFMMFDPHGDLKDKNGVAYNYWSDGSIRNLPESPANEPVSMIIKRDYSYETKLTDSLKSYSRNTFYIPIGIGAKFNMGYRANIRIGVIYNLCMSDYIDNYKTGGNDSWLQAQIGFNYSFGKKPSDGYEGVNFKDVDKSDSDGDGVADINDRCLGTPKGVKVDKSGCPEDKDEDGVFDYMDKELNTKKGAIVDGNGVTINVDEYAKRQLEWDSLATERSEGFNNAPSLSYLKDVENKSKNVGKKSTIPVDFQAADLNKDGYISAEEITKTIDSFFEGESSFTVEKINKLIDFFFEQ